MLQADNLDLDSATVFATDPPIVGSVDVELARFLTDAMYAETCDSSWLIAVLDGAFQLVTQSDNSFAIACCISRINQKVSLAKDQLEKVI